MKTRSMSKAGHAAGTTVEPSDAVRAAQAEIRKDPSLPENYTLLAGSLRTLAQSLRELDPQSSDHLLHLACAAAWEAKTRSGPGLTSGRTKQEVKILIAWVRTKNHLGPEASESLMDQIRSDYLDRALDSTDPLREAGV